MWAANSAHKLKALAHTHTHTATTPFDGRFWL